MYWLLVATGMRRGEAIGLRWEDVNLPESVLVVVQQITEVRGRSVVGSPKTRRSSRLVSLDATTVAALQQHADRQAQERSAWGAAWEDTGLVFTREDGRALRPEYVTRRFQALAERAGLPAIRLHDLRHTNAGLALRAGVPLKVVSDRLGHSQTAITADLYTHVEEQVSRDAAQRISDVLDATGDAAASSSQPVPGPRSPAAVTHRKKRLPRRRPPPTSLLVRGFVRRCLNERARQDSNLQPSDP